MRSAELPTALKSQGENKPSHISVITQARAPVSTLTTITTSNAKKVPGHTTTRPHTATGDRVPEEDREASLTERPSTSMSSRSRTKSKAERSASRAADVDYHAALRIMGGQDPTVKRRNKLEKMFGGPVPMGNSNTVTRKSGSFQHDDEIPDLPPLPNSPMTSVPQIPIRSPRRPSASLKAPHSQHRPSHSIDRSTYNCSVASTANPESDLTNLDSDIFTDADDDASSFTSGPSSVVAGDSKQVNTEPAQVSPTTQPTTISPLEEDIAEPEQQPAVRIVSETIDAPPARHNQKLPTPPDATSCYHMLAMRSPTGIERSDFGASCDPFLAMTGVSTHHLASNVRDVSEFLLMQRPASPADSTVSDDSFDSALPPPIGLHRDVVGPKYRSRSEQKRAYRKPPPEPTKPKQKQQQQPDRAQSRTTMRSKSAVDLTVRPQKFATTSGTSRSASRNASVSTHISDDRDRRARTPFDQPIKSSVGFSWSGFFGRNKKSKEVEEPVMLPPLRKITFDARGQKQVLDLKRQNSDEMAAVAASEHPDDEDWDELAKAREGLGSRAYSIAGERIESSTGMMGGRAAWRIREPGAPRRTAWK